MKIKTILSFHLISVTMAKINNSGEIRCWLGNGERGTLFHCWWDYKLVQQLWKSVWWFLRKLDIVLTEDPAIPLLGTYPEDVPTCNKDTSFTMFITSLFIIARSWKEPICPSKEELIQKMWYIYTMEYYSSTKTNATWHHQNSVISPQQALDTLTNVPHFLYQFICWGTSGFFPASGYYK